MRIRDCTITLAAVCSLAVSACDRSEEPVEDATPATEAAQPARGLDVGLEAARQMPQTLRDSARAAYGRDTVALGRALRSGAAYAREQAEQADEATRTALDRSAAEMDSLAASVAAGARRTDASLDSAFARLEHAMGLSNLANATNAWAEEQRARAGEDLEAAADNLERAASNAQVTLDTGAEKAAADARAVAGRLRQAAEVSADEFRQVTEELDAHFRSLGSRIGGAT